MSEYYTPEIEEFHVGFEFCDRHSNYPEEEKNWVKRDYTLRAEYMLDNISGRITEGLIRVKCLDREDIESLGWKFEEECPAWISFNMSGEKNLTLYKESKKVEILIPDNPLQYHYSFAGTIKNKSELKKLLKQLGI